MVSSVTVMLRDRAFMGRTVNRERITETVDGAGRVVNKSTVTTENISGYIIHSTEKNLQDGTYGLQFTGDAIGVLEPEQFKTGDIIHETRDNNRTYKWKVSDLIRSPRNHLHEVTLETFALTRLDNL